MPISNPSRRSIALLIAEGDDRLERAGIAQPRLEAEVLLAARLATTRGRLIVRSEDEVEPAAEAAYRTDLERRAGRYPLQYITGVQEFYSLDFAVDERVLIPRPETEMIVDEVLRRARLAQVSQIASSSGVQTPPSPEAQNLRSAVAQNPLFPVPAATAPATLAKAAGYSDSWIRVVDAGTGSGCIAIAIAKNLQECFVLATDLSDQALEVARGNAERHGVADRIQFAGGDGLDPAFAAGLEGRADFVVSNPPYIDESDLPCLQAELQHEPRIALSPGPDGLAMTARLVSDASHVLRPGGSLLVEISIGRSDEARRLLPEAVWRDVAVQADLQGIPRLLVATLR